MKEEQSRFAYENFWRNFKNLIWPDVLFQLDIQLKKRNLNKTD